MKVIVPADVADQPAVQQEKKSSHINWYPLLGLKLVLSTAAATYGALAFLLFGD